MDKVQQIVTIAAAILSLTAGLLTFLIKTVKNGKAKRILQQTLDITEALQPLIIKAEEFTHYTGAEKKQFVLTLANQYALENKLKFDAQRTGELIDQLVETTKKVNARPKDKAAELNKQSAEKSMSI